MARPAAALAHLQPQAFPATGPESVFRYEDEHESGSRDGPTVRVGRGILGLGAGSWICSPARPPRSPRECCGPAGRPDGCGGCRYGRWRSPSGARSARRRRGGGGSTRWPTPRARRRPRPSRPPAPHRPARSSSRTTRREDAATEGRGSGPYGAARRSDGGLGKGPPDQRAFHQRVGRITVEGHRSDASFAAGKARMSSSVRIRSVGSVMIILRRSAHTPVHACLPLETGIARMSTSRWRALPVDRDSPKKVPLRTTRTAGSGSDLENPAVPEGYFAPGGLRRAWATAGWRSPASSEHRIC